MVRAIRCHRQNMKTSIINGSEVSRLSVAIQAAEIWLAKIHEVGVPVALLLSVAEAINLPQTQAKNMLIEAGGIMMPGNPIKISGCADPHVMPGAATRDQHGKQIRQEFSS